jgi:hypothetical protein
MKTKIISGLFAVSLLSGLAMAAPGGDGPVVTCKKCETTEACIDFWVGKFCKDVELCKPMGCPK